MIKSKFVWLWIGYVALTYLLPWWHRVYFLFDDLVFLMQLRTFNLRGIFLTHGYQFHPVFTLLFWLETQLFGVNPSGFLLVSILIHLVNIYLVFEVMRIITRSTISACLSAVLVSFNKSYFTVLFWPAIQSNTVFVAFFLMSVIVLLRLKQQFQWNHVILLAVTVSLATFSTGFGVLTGFVLALFAFMRTESKKTRAVIVSICGAIGISAMIVTLLISAPQVGADRDMSFSPRNFFSAVYFVAVGVSQTTITRFFLPGFVPNIHNPLNTIVMVIVPTIILLWFFWIVWNAYRRQQLKGLIPLFLFAVQLVIPFTIASLARSGPGALGGLAERYIYIPFFFFSMCLMYGVFSTHRLRLKKNNHLTNIILVGSVIILSIGHQLTMYFELNQLFI